LPVVAVFDTNILISARLSATGIPAQCVNLARNGQVESITCQELLDEFAEKLEEKFSRSRERALDAASEIRSFSRMVVIGGTLNAVPRDPDDNMVIECAVVGGATHIVTGDKKHLLPIGSYEGIAIVTAAEFLALVAANP
jgi:uncharacterized protein